MHFIFMKFLWIFSLIHIIGYNKLLLKLRFPGHAENVLLLNYILRNDVKWRTTETALFRIFDATGSIIINNL